MEKESSIKDHVLLDRLRTDSKMVDFIFNYQNGNISIEEEDQLDVWVEQSDCNKNIFNFITNANYRENSSKVLKARYARVKQPEAGVTSIVSRSRVVIISACMILLAAAIILFNWLNS